MNKPQEKTNDIEITILSDQLIEISESDFNASVILHNSELYSQSVFALQQSVEKLVKAIGLKIRVISPKELKRKIGHNTYKVYLKGVRLLIEGTELFDVEKLKEDHMSQYFKIYSSFKEIENVFLDWKLNSDHTYDDKRVLQILDVLEHGLENAERKIVSRKNMTRSKDNDELLIKLSQILYLMFTNFGMLILTSNHFDICRYPTCEKKIHPNLFYNSEHYLVKHYNDIIKYHKKSIEFMKRICKK